MMCFQGRYAHKIENYSGATQLTFLWNLCNLQADVHVGASLMVLR